MASVNKVISPRPIEELATEYLGGRSLPQIAAAGGGSVSTLRRRLIEHGVEMRPRVAAMTMAKREGRGISPKSGKYKRSAEIIAKLSASRKALPCAGVSHKPSGYIEMTRGPDKHRGQHRVIVEMALGRKLQPNEVVHHRDEDKTNNQLENLEVMTRAEHARLHIIQRLERNKGQ